LTNTSLRLDNRPINCRRSSNTHSSLVTRSHATGQTICHKKCHKNWNVIKVC